MKNSISKITFAIAVATALSVTNSANAQIAEISGTGWNQDLVVEVGAGSGTAGITGATTGNVADWNFYESGYSLDGIGPVGQGLDSSGAYSSANGSYQMQAYDGLNAIQNAGTFTLDTADSYASIGLLLTGQSPGGGISFDTTLTFADATQTIVTSPSISDWIATPNAATPTVVSNHGLVNINNSSYAGDLFMVEAFASLSAADQMKDLVSIKITPVTGDNIIIHAISGEQAQAVPEPTSTGLIGMGVLALFSRRRRTC